MVLYMGIDGESRISTGVVGVRFGQVDVRGYGRWSGRAEAGQDEKGDCEEGLHVVGYC